MRRREFVGLIAGTATWPLVARPQQPSMPMIGFLHSASAVGAAPLLTAFQRGLTDAGYIEGQNVAIEYRWADGQYRKLRALASDLVRRQVAVIFAAGVHASALAAQAATSTLPVVIVFEGDPVQYRLVSSLNRPGANITGVASSNLELFGKRLSLLRDMVPPARTVAFLAGTPQYLTYHDQTSAILAAGRVLGIEIIIFECRDDGDFDSAFKKMTEQRVVALVIGAFPLGNLNKVVALAARHNIPAMYPGRGFIPGGGLMSYGANYPALYQTAAVQYVARILKGDNPADLPMQQASKFEFVINLKAAKALGIDVPPQLLALADEVIE